LRGLFLTLAGIYVLVRIGAVAGAAPVSSYPDSQEYLATAHHSLLSSDFWAGERSPAVALLYKLLPSDHLREIGQVALSIAAWLGLAAALARSLKMPAARVAGFVAVLLLGSTPWVVEWDPLMLSESLSLTLTAALVAVWLELIRRPRRGWAAALVVLALLWTTARDPNGYVLLFALAIPAVWLARSEGRQTRRLPALVMAGLLVAALAGIASASGGERWKVPLVNVIGHRVLGDADAAAMFHSRGMPQLTPQVDAAMRVPGFIDHDRLHMQPGWPDLDRWLDDAGRQTYIRYLAGHPGVAITVTFDQREQLFSVAPPGEPANFPLEDYEPAGLREPLPRWLSALVFAPAAWVLLLLLALFTVVFGVLLRRGAATRYWIVPGALVALAVPHAFVIVLGDTSELTRHALLLGLTVRLALLVAAALTLDAVAVRVAAARRTRTPSDRAYARP
jgi:hypothetical protein